MIALASILLAALSADAPFADLDYRAALDRAKEQQKLLFVDFTASWCPPCKKMEADTWPNADVVAWLGEHAIAIQVDVDKEKELAQQFKIKAMPTVVVLRGGEEFDRVVGYKDAAGFLAWAQDVAEGKRSSDELMRRAEDLAESDDVHARYDLARDLLRAERYDLALEHYLWLWPATRKSPGMGGVRLSFMLGNMAELAREYPPAKQAFQEILEDLQIQVDADGVPLFETWQEWTSICEHFGQKTRIVAWYERRRDAEGRLFSERSGEFMVQLMVDEITAVLMHEDRPKDAANLIWDSRAYAASVVERFEQIEQANEGLDEQIREDSKQFSRQRFANDLSKVYAALLAAGRREEATDVAALLIRTLDTPEARLALFRAGVAVAHGPEESLDRWLDEAEAAGANVRLLRHRLERLAEAKPGDSEEPSENSKE